MTSLPSPIRVLVVDDHPLLREGIAAVLAGQPDMELVGEACDGADAIDRHAALRPDVTLMDLQMPGTDGIQAIRAIRKAVPDARIAILTTYRGDVRALHAIEAGAQGYLLKSALRKELIEAIRALAAGRRYFPAEIATELANHIGKDVLTPREIQVLQRLAAGLANKQVASELGVSEDTVKGHVSSLMEKLGASNRTHAVALGIERGIIAL